MFPSPEAVGRGLIRKAHASLCWDEVSSTPGPQWADPVHCHRRFQPPDRHNDTAMTAGGRGAPNPTEEKFTRDAGGDAAPIGDNKPDLNGRHVVTL